MDQLLSNKAKNILLKNDLGNYTVPTHGLYPYQWNWDSCLTALGLYYLNEERAWIEIETLFKYQWDDGMVPHIVFHQKSEGYFPGPEIWNTGRPGPTSGITQPPVVGFTLKKIFEKSKNKEKYLSRAKELVYKIHKWHQWFYDYRDPKGSGLVAILHPWESGRDNSVDWDDSLTKVPTTGVSPFVRRDTKHANPEHRPTEEQYKKYIWLLELFRSLNYDNSKLHNASPFCVVDPGFNAILIKSCYELSKLATDVGEKEIAEKSKKLAEKGQVALEKLWSKPHNQYVCFDRYSNKNINSASIGGLLPILTNLSMDKANALEDRIDQLAKKTKYVIASHDKDDNKFEHLRYWRGPVWLIMNYMIIIGLKNLNKLELANKIYQNSLELIREKGFAEYYSPLDGTPCGGQSFSWTAAMVLDFINNPDFNFLEI